MTEVEKLYELAGVEKIGSQYANNISKHLISYPPFTAEKQIEIVKFLLKKYNK